VWTGFSCLRIGINGGILWTRYWTFWNFWNRWAKISFLIIILPLAVSQTFTAAVGPRRNGETVTYVPRFRPAENSVGTDGYRCLHQHLEPRDNYRPQSNHSQGKNFNCIKVAAYMSSLPGSTGKTKTVSSFCYFRCKFGTRKRRDSPFLACIHARLSKAFSVSDFRSILILSRIGSSFPCRMNKGLLIFSPDATLYGKSVKCYQHSGSTSVPTPQFAWPIIITNHPPVAPLEISN
jgi:hypothetical protein